METISFLFVVCKNWWSVGVGMFAFSLHCGDESGRNLQLAELNIVAHDHGGDVCSERGMLMDCTENPWFFCWFSLCCIQQGVVEKLLSDKWHH